MFMPIILATAVSYVEIPARMEVSIDPTGKVVGCTVLDNMPPVLAEAGCRMMLQGASYPPERDSSGQPIAAKRTVTIQFRIPKS